ncbi:hypothetical protein Tco_1026970 [Tanacetum coccineum]
MSTLSLDELIGSEDDASSSDSNDEEYAMAVRDTKSSLEEEASLFDNPMMTKRTSGRQRKKRRKRKTKDASSVVIQITSLVIVPNTPSVIKRRLLSDVGAIVEMTPRRKRYVSWPNQLSSSLRKMVKMQKPSKEKYGLGYTEDIASTSNNKIKILGPQNDKMLSVELATPVPSAREPACSDEQNRLSTAKTENAEKAKILGNYLTKFDPKSTEGVFLGYSPNSKAYVILNKETMRVEESLNVKFDESPPLKSPPLVDDDILENDIIENQDKDLEIKKNEPLNKEITNIKNSKDHPIETVIGSLNERTLRS